MQGAQQLIPIWKPLKAFEASLCIRPLSFHELGDPCCLTSTSPASTACHANSRWQISRLGVVNTATATASSTTHCVYCYIPLSSVNMCSAVILCRCRDNRLMQSSMGSSGGASPMFRYYCHTLTIKLLFSSLILFLLLVWRCMMGH